MSHFRLLDTRSHCHQPVSNDQVDAGSCGEKRSSDENIEPVSKKAKESEEPTAVTGEQDAGVGTEESCSESAVVTENAEASTAAAPVSDAEIVQPSTEKLDDLGSGGVSTENAALAQ